MLSTSDFRRMWMLLEKKKMPKYIIDDIEISSDSDRENFDKENLKKILI